MATSAKKKSFNPFKVTSVALGKSSESMSRPRSAKRLGRPSTDPSYLADVKAKVKRHPLYKDCGENEIHQLAVSISEEAEMKKYFSELLDVSEHMKDLEKETDDELSSSIEVAAANGRSRTRLEETGKFSVKLLLTPLQQGTSRVVSTFAKHLELKYGPLHAAIQVGDITLEWNTGSLVIPDFAPPDNPAMIMSIDPNEAIPNSSISASGINIVETCLSTTPTPTDTFQGNRFKEEIDFAFDMIARKHEILSALIAIAVKYNRYKYYNVMSRNCQKFVRDALAAIGVTDIPQLGGGKLKEYFDQVKGQKELSSEFETHSQLDEYVSENSKVEMSIGDLEYLLCMYFQFHMTSKTESENPTEWECQQPNCQMAVLESRIDKNSVLLLRQYTEN